MAEKGRTLKITILGDAGAAKKAVGDLGGGLDQLAGQAKKVGVAIAALGAAAGAAVAGGIALSIKSYAEAGDQLQKMRDRTGLAVETLSELKYAAGLSGTSIEGLENAVRRMQRGLFDANEGMKSSQDAFRALGLDWEALAQATPEEQFLAISGALADVEDASVKAALAQEIFGRAGTELLPMLAAGSEGLQAMRDEAHALGVVMSNDDAEAAAAFNDSLDRLKQALDGFKFAIAREVIPVLTDLATKALPRLIELQENLKAWWERNRPIIVEAVQAISRVVIQLFEYFRTGVETVVPLLRGLWSFIVDNKPVLIAVMTAIGIAVASVLGPAGAIVLGVAAVITAIGFFRDNWATIWAHVQDIALKGADKVLGVIETLAKGFAFIEKPLEFLSGGTLDIPSAEQGVQGLRSRLRTIDPLGDLRAEQSRQHYADVEARRRQEEIDRNVENAGVDPWMRRHLEEQAEASEQAADSLADFRLEAGETTSAVGTLRTATDDQAEAVTEAATATRDLAAEFREAQKVAEELRREQERERDEKIRLRVIQATGLAGNMQTAREMFGDEGVGINLTTEGFGIGGAFQDAATARERVIASAVAKGFADQLPTLISQLNEQLAQQGKLEIELSEDLQIAGAP